MFKHRIEEILTEEVVSVSPETPFVEAIRLMQSKGISCLPVVSGETPVGIFTERNLTRHLVRAEAQFGEHTMAEVMTSPVVTVRKENLLYEAYGLLVTNKIRHLIVVDRRNRVVGIVTFSDILSHLGSEYYLDVKKVSQIMSRSIATISAGETVGQALTAMVDRDISCLIVTEGKQPLGVVTERDIARSLQKFETITELRVAHVMSSPVRTVSLDTPVYEAGSIMRQENIRRLVAVDDEGNIAGLTTQSDIIMGLEGKYIQTLRTIVREKDTALKDTMKDLHDKSLYLDGILRSAFDMGIVATDLQGGIVYFNPAAGEILQCPPQKAVGSDIRELRVAGGLDAAILDEGFELVRQGAIHKFQFPLHRSRAVLTVEGRISGIWDEEQKLMGFVLMLRDVTERKRAEETIRYMAYHDTLTGIPNRQLFDDRLLQALARSKRQESGLVLMVLDLDLFKEINDTYGHHAGDIVLKTIARRLEKLIRESDTVARMGGDEFLLLFPDVSGMESAVALAKRMIPVLEEPIDIEETSLRVTMSIGIALYPDHGETAEQLIRAADKAMYMAKEKSRVNKSFNIAGMQENPSG